MKEREKIRYRLSVNHLSFAWLIDMLRKRGMLNICGYFTSKEQAEFCMHKIAEILGREVENPPDHKGVTV